MVVRSRNLPPGKNRRPAFAASPGAVDDAARTTGVAWRPAYLSQCGRPAVTKQTRSAAAAMS